MTPTALYNSSTPETNPEKLVMPYRLLLKDGKYFPQLFEQPFGSRRQGDIRYDTEEGARKFLKRQAANRVLATQTCQRKGQEIPHPYAEYEQSWLAAIETAPVVVADSKSQAGTEIDAREILTEDSRKKYRYNPMQMKYIVVKSEDAHGRIHELPVMFPYVLIHKEMKECVWRALIESEHRFIECVGAGFCTVENNVVKCYGESESLGIASRGKLDTQAFDRCERSETSTIVER